MPLQGRLIAAVLAIEGALDDVGEITLRRHVRRARLRRKRSRILIG